MDPAPHSLHCAHCGGPLPAATTEGFCCAGCRFVYELLREERLERYYDLRGGKGTAVTTSGGDRDRKWLEPLAADLARAEGLHRLELDVQGLACAACVWLIAELFRREAGAAHIVVNPALGRMRLTASREFPLRRFVERVESCGYLVGPRLKSTPGLWPLRIALAYARRLRVVLATTLSVALLYNIVTVSLACAGLMTPLVCAVLMPQRPPAAPRPNHETV